MSAPPFLKTKSLTMPVLRHLAAHPVDPNSVEALILSRDATLYVLKNKNWTLIGACAVQLLRHRTSHRIRLLAIDLDGEVQLNQLANGEMKPMREGYQTQSLAWCAAADDCADGKEISAALRFKDADECAEFHSMWNKARKHHQRSFDNVGEEFPEIREPALTLTAHPFHVSRTPARPLAVTLWSKLINDKLGNALSADEVECVWNMYCKEGADRLEALDLINMLEDLFRACLLKSGASVAAESRAALFVRLPQMARTMIDTLSGKPNSSFITRAQFSKIDSLDRLLA